MLEILLSALTTLAVLTACCAFWTTLMPDCGPATWHSPVKQRQVSQMIKFGGIWSTSSTGPYILSP